MDHAVNEASAQTNNQSFPSQAMKASISSINQYIKFVKSFALPKTSLEFIRFKCYVGNEAKFYGSHEA
ncbi:hypothetical protein Dimus_027419 [Dionaea muscipula]